MLGRLGPLWGGTQRSQSLSLTLLQFQHLESKCNPTRIKAHCTFFFLRSPFRLQAFFTERRPYPSISPPPRLGHCAFPCAALRYGCVPQRGPGADLIPEQRVRRDLQEVTRGGQDGTGRYYFHSSVDSAESLGSAGSGMRDAVPTSKALMLICCFLTWIRAEEGLVPSYRIFPKGLSGSVGISNE